MGEVVQRCVAVGEGSIEEMGGGGLQRIDTNSTLSLLSLITTPIYILTKRGRISTTILTTRSGDERVSDF